MKTCPYCLSEIANNAKKCKYCDEIVIEGKKVKLCPYCESEVSETARKCKHCWERINEKSEEQKSYTSNLNNKISNKNESKHKSIWWRKIFIMIILFFVCFIILANIYDTYKKNKLIEDKALYVLSEIEKYTWNEDMMLIKNRFLSNYNELLEAAKKDWLEINNKTITLCVYGAILEVDTACKLMNSFDPFCKHTIEANSESLQWMIKKYDYKFL
jgi:preprotein translocase subunit SecG